MATLVVIDQPIRVDVDEDVSPHAFWSVTTSDITAVDWAATEEAPLEVTFADDLTTEQIDAIVRIARALPANVPPPDVPPGSVNTPEVFQPGTRSLGIKWQAVTNATPVMYDIYLSNAPGAYAPANFLASTAATMAISDTLPDATPLEHGVTYYWAIQSRSGDQMGPVSSEVSGTLAQINSADIVAEAITADLIAAGAITAEKLDALIVIAGEIATAETGARSGISATEGFFSLGPDGNLIFQAHEGNLFVDGDINARTLNVVEGATWSGANVGMPGASTMMADSLGAPGNPPTVETVYDTVTLDTVFGDDLSYRRGLVWHDSHWWVASGVTTDSNEAGLLLLKFTAAGAHVATYAATDSMFRDADLSLTLVGSTFYVFATGWNFLYQFNATTGAYLGLTILSGWTQHAINTGCIGSNGTNLLFSWRTASGSAARWQEYSTSGSPIGAEVEGLPATQSGTTRAILGGTFDLGASRVVVAASGVEGFRAATFTASGTYDASRIFLTPGWRGLAWDGSKFVALGSDGRTLSLHTNILKDEASATVPLAVGATWYDSAGTTHESTVSPRATVEFPKRAKYRLRTAGKVPGLGGADDPDGARFYVGRTTGRLKLQLHATVTPGAGQYAAATLALLALPIGSGDAVTPPPASGNFAAATPYRHYSQAVDSNGWARVDLNGAGYAGGQGLRPVGEITMWAGSSGAAPADWLICDGSAVSRTTYARLFTILGTTFGAGNGSTTFNLPDLRSRFPIGVGTYASLGGNEDDAESARTTVHAHSATGLTTSATGGGGVVQRGTGALNTAAGDHTHNVTGTTGTSGGPGGHPHLGVHFIIRAL